MSSLLKVLVVTGSSGGHIFPALAFLDTLENNKSVETLLVLPKKNILSGRDISTYHLRCISITSFSLSLGLRNFLSLFRFFQGIIESVSILLEFRPHIVVGFGSLSSVPLIIFSRVLGIKSLIHEQNVIPGRANRLLARFSNMIAISFAESREHFKASSKRLVFTGNPLRKELICIDKARALGFFGLDQDKFTILVSGGSQGSERVNQGFLKALSMLRDKSRVQVIHITGPLDLAEAKKRYAGLGVSARCFAFFDKMQYAYSCCDLIVSRGGATTIAEIMFFGLAAIIIPYPYAYRHQLANARVLELRKVARIINDNALDTGILQDTLQDFLSNPGQITAMRSSYNNFIGVDTNLSFSQAVLSLN